MQRYLEKHCAKVTTCVDGAEAVAEAFRAPYDVLLMDIQMPVMDGYQDTGLLRERGYDKPIIALTAHASAIDRQKCYEVGCNFYLSKPVNITYLLDVLTKRMNDGTWPADANRNSH
jgi:CheY-like chemotaxis protein